MLLARMRTERQRWVPWIRVYPCASVVDSFHLRISENTIYHSNTPGEYTFYANATYIS